MGRNIKKTLLLTTAAAAAGAGGLAYAGLRTAILRRDRTPEQWEHYLTTGRWNAHSDEIIREIQWFSQQDTEDLSLHSRDGLRLRATYLEAPHAKACVLLCHGFRSSGLIDFSLVLRLFYENRCSVLLIDQRAHGRSEGRYIGYGILERYDCQQWAWFLHAKLGGRLPIFLEGISMGAATVMMASELPLPSSVAGVIADCGYNSPWDELRHCIRRWYRLPAFPVLHLTDIACRLTAGYSLKDVSSAQALANSRLPVLFIHGTGDNFVPADMTAENYAAAMGEKRTVIVEGADHGFSYVEDRERCRKEVLDFIDTYAESCRGA